MTGDKHTTGLTERFIDECGRLGREFGPKDRPLAGYPTGHLADALKLTLGDTTNNQIAKNLSRRIGVSERTANGWLSPQQGSRGLTCEQLGKVADWAARTANATPSNYEKAIRDENAGFLVDGPEFFEDESYSIAYRFFVENLFGMAQPDRITCKRLALIGAVLDMDEEELDAFAATARLMPSQRAYSSPKPAPWREVMDGAENGTGFAALALGPLPDLMDGIGKRLGRDWQQATSTVEWAREKSAQKPAHPEERGPFL